MRKKKGWFAVVLLATGLAMVSGLGFGWAQEEELVPVPWEAPFWVLDGFGGIHAVNGAQPLHGLPYVGFDAYTKLELIRVRCDIGQVLAVVLDSFGGVWKVSANPALEKGVLPNSPYFGFDAARDVVFSIHPDWVWHRSCMQ